MALVLMLTPFAAINVSAISVTDATEGVVRICTLNQDASSLGFGSAIAIGTVGEETDLFVTNLHCVQFENDLGETVMANRVYIVTDSSSLKTIELALASNTNYSLGYIFDLETSGMVLCDVIGYIDGLDVAILRASKPVSGRYALEIAARDKTESAVSVGDTVYALGYPSNSDDCVNTTDWSVYEDDTSLVQRTTTYSSLVKDVSVTKGTVSKFTTSTIKNNAKVIQMDVEISSGNSGGALINEDGVVVGINTSGSTTTNLNFALYSDYIWQVADSCGVADEINVGVSGVNIALIIGIVVAVVVIIVLIAVIIVLASKSKKQPKVGAGSQVIQGGYIPSGTDNRQGQDVQKVEAPRKADSGFPEGPRVQAISGSLVGNRYPITGTLRIGRNPDCNEIVIPAGTDGVSGVHCKLSLVNGQVVLTDLGSTYGTYGNEGQRLAANQSVTLRVGDKFYLGSKKEMFEIVRKGGAK